MKKSYLWMVAAIGMATLFSGCSKSENGLEMGENVEIMAKSKALTLDASTKAPFEGDIATGNTLSARVLVTTATTGNYNSLHADGTMIFGDETNAFGYNSITSGSKYFPGVGINMVGLHPATGWGAFTTTSTFTINGKTDLMAAAQVSTTKADAKGGTYPQLVFNHLLTKLDVKVIAADAGTATAWGKITDLKLTGAKGGLVKDATVTLAAGTALFGTSANSLSFYKVSDDDEISGLTGTNQITIPYEAGNPLAYSMVAPVTLDGSTNAQTEVYTLSVTTTNSGSAISVPITITPKAGSSITSTAGYAFTITLTFAGTEIKATATVTDWAEGGTGAGTIE